MPLSLCGFRQFLLTSSDSGSIADCKPIQCLKAGTSDTSFCVDTFLPTTARSGSSEQKALSQCFQPLPNSNLLQSVGPARPVVMTAWVCWWIQTYEVSLRYSSARGKLIAGSRRATIATGLRPHFYWLCCQEGARQPAPKFRFLFT